MPIHTYIKEGLTVFVTEGRLSVGDIVEAITWFYQNGKTKNSLWDLRAAHLVDFPSEGAQQISQVASQYKHQRQGGKTAIVASRDVDYGIARMHQAYMADFPWELEVFRSAREACDWIGVDWNMLQSHDGEPT